MSNLNKSNIEVLSILIKEDCTSVIKSYSIKQLLDKMENKYSRAKITNDLNLLIVGNYISKGLKQGHADTFYITKSGIETLTQISK